MEGSILEVTWPQAAATPGLGTLGKSRCSGELEKSDPVGLGQGLRFCISHKLPGKASDAGTWTTHRVERPGGF